jgi:hypothetical protein
MTPAQPYTLTRFAGELANLVAGLLIWAGHFAVVYGVHAVACARGLSERTLFGFGAVPFIVTVATVLALLGSLVVLAVALRDLRTLRGRGDASDSQRFLTYTSATIASFSILAIVWVALPAAIVPPCV